MPEINLRQPRFTYSACGSFPKNKERIQKLKKTGDLRYIYQNELVFKLEGNLLIKYCMIKHLILRKILNTINAKEVLLQWFMNFLIKRLLLNVPIDLLVVVLKMRIFSDVKNENISGHQLSEEFHKEIIKKFKKKKSAITFHRQYLGCRFKNRICFYYVSLIFSVNMHGLFL